MERIRFLLACPVTPRAVRAFSGSKALVLAALVLAACSGEPESPEVQVRRILERAEAAAEAKDVPALGAFVSDRYLGSRGETKQSVLGLTGFYLNRHRSVHLLTRIESMHFPEPGRAQVVLLVAMAGNQIAGPEELAALRADLYRFELTMADERGWQVVGARWRRASVQDFLGGAPGE